SLAGKKGAAPRRNGRRQAGRPLWRDACGSLMADGGQAFIRAESSSSWRVLSIRAKSPYVDVKGVLEILNSLYPNKAFALVRENLQNSIDAGARNIWISFDPASRKATFIDDGTGIPVARMNEREYFALMWSTKRGKDLIGSKGIGRLTNIAAAKSVTVESNDGRHRAVFTWHSNGSFSKHRNAAPTLTHTGLSLKLLGLRPIVAEDLAKKVDEVATDVFDDYLR